MINTEFNACLRAVFRILFYVTDIKAPKINIIMRELKKMPMTVSYILIYFCLFVFLSLLLTIMNIFFPQDLL